MVQERDMMAQKKGNKQGHITIRVEASKGLPSMTLAPNRSAITAHDIRRIVAKLKGVK